MFVRYYLEVEVPFADLEAALLDRPEAWVPGLLRAAEDRGQHLLAEVGFDVETGRIDREVEIHVGSPRRMKGTTLLPMTWRTTAGERLFPQLDADIQIAALGASRTQLSMSASYRPPLGALGRLLDRALLHRVAEATIKDFLDRVAEAIGAGRGALDRR